MNNVTKTEIILSVLGFSILFYILTYLIPHIDEFNLYERFYANSQYLNEQSRVLPIYKQDEKMRKLPKLNGYKTPFRTTSGIFNQEMLLAETANSIHIQETSDLLNTNYAVSVFPKTQNNTGSNIIFNDSYTPVRRSGNNSTIVAQGFSKLSTWNNPQSTNNRPFYAGEAIDDVILVDPMADPDESERIPAGSNPWILLIFASMYGLYKNRRLYLAKAQTKD